MQVVSAQLPPIQHSDDKIFTTGNAVILLDGASAFVPVPVPASTYADQLGRALQYSLAAYPDADLRAALAAAIQSTALELGLQPVESPSSTITILRELGDHLDLLVLGDNLVMLPDETITDDRVDRLELPPRRKYRERLAAGAGFDEEHRAILRELQTQQAQRRNRVGGYWTAETDPAAAWQAITRRRRVSRTPWAILASDGAYNTMQYLGITDWSTLAAADTEELDTTLMRCQCWETANDPAGAALPRAKCHDDKSLAVVTFTGDPR
ncbi:hypothetical protein [Amycolatopsis palatopharyngis]|uniref:hypothetical protein n=1 Tax=Amycolatopsis palatopharyngis TaxID=187982 RepID=UPI000E239535|nr:hypothetical protein [Amycolatopsis palatopharyngis]